MKSVKLKRLDHGYDLPLPFYATTGSAGADIAAAIEEDVVLTPGSRILIPSGFSVEAPTGHEIQIRPRSGLAFKHGITVLNTPGTVDADYRGEIKILLVNLGTENFTISRGLRIAQLVVAPITYVYWEEVLDLIDLDTERRGKGFGSTGTR